MLYNKDFADMFRVVGVAAWEKKYKKGLNDG